MSRDCHSAYAITVFWYDLDWATAERHYLRALELDPNSAQAHFSYAHLLSNIGRHEEALRESKRARELDPVNLVTNAVEGLVLSTAGRDDEGLKILQSTAEMEPKFWLAHLFMTGIYLRKEMYDEAIESATKGRDLTHGNAQATATIGYALARSGRSKQAREILTEMENRARTEYLSAYARTQIYTERRKALSICWKRHTTTKTV